MSKQPPFYSVVIPTYNRASQVNYTISSVLKQTFQDFEIIVVDDFSEDIAELEELILKFNNERIKLVKHTQNKNGAAARNSGIEAASGCFIAFLDSDDTWPNDRLSKVHNEVTKCDSHENTVFYGQVDFKRFDKTEGQKKPAQSIGRLSVSEYLFESNGLIQTSTIVVSRKLAETVKFDERYTRHQDYDFVLRAESIGCQFVFIPQVLSNWLQYPGTSTLAKGANVDFCLFWHSEMGSYFKGSSAHSYLIKIVVPLAIESGRYKVGAKLFLKNFLRVPFRVLAQSMVRASKAMVKRVLRLFK